MTGVAAVRPLQSVEPLAVFPRPQTFLLVSSRE